MTESEYYYSKADRECNHSDYQHEAIMNRLVELQEYNLFSLLKPKIFIDGNHWCVLYGDDLQAGLAGFGETPYLAILDFNKSFYRTLKPTP